MANQGPIVMSDSNPLDINGVVSNVATERADYEAKGNVDGKDIYPNTVRTRHFTAESMMLSDGSFLADGVIRANHLVSTENVITSSLQVGNTIITSEKMSVSSLSSINANLGTITAGTITGVTINLITGSPGTGVSMTGTRLYGQKSGTVIMDLDLTEEFYYFKGEIYADKITIAQNANNSVYFGASITIDGDIIMTPTAGSKTTYIKNATTSPTIYLMWLGGASYFNATNHYISCTGAGSFATGGAMTLDAATDMTVEIGTTSSDQFLLRRGSTTVMSFDGDDSTVTFTGGVLVGSGAAGSGLLYFGNDLTNYLYYSNDGKLTWTSGDGQDTFQTQDVIASNHYIGTSTSTPRISTGTGAPSGGSDGDLYIRTGTTNSGASRLYQNVGGTWKSIYAVPV